MRNINVIFALLFSFISFAQPSLKEILDAPFASDLTVSKDGNTIAWVDNAAGERNIFIATGKRFSKVSQLTHFKGDEGISLGSLLFTPDGKKLVFIRGNTKNRKGEAANPALLQQNTEQIIYIQALDEEESSQIAAGSQPRISPNGKSIAFLKSGQVWTSSLTDESLEPKQLFNTRGNQSDIKWSPKSTHIAFTSRRGDHSYIGVYDLVNERLSFMDPSVDIDFSPEWNSDNTRIAYIRRPNAKDIAPFTPQLTAHPWSIKILDIKDGSSQTIWTADKGMGSVFFSQFPSAALEWADGDQLIFPWEKEGWVHLYSLDVSSGRVSHLTPGEGIVEDYHLSKDKKKIHFTTNIGDSHRRHIGEIDISSKQMNMLTIGSGVEYRPQSTRNGLVFLHTTAQHTSRPALLEDSRIRLIGNSAKVFNNQRIPEIVEIDATDNRKFKGQLFYPDNYDRTKKYPVAIFLHGGSRRQMLQAYHYSGYYSNAFALQQYFASQGYIALSINYRSGIGYGAEFREADEYGITGASEVRDLIGAGEYLAKRNDVDQNRIALWGGSYGGYLTAHGLAQRSDLFAVGVDIHGVHNWNTELPTFTPWYDVVHYPKVAALAFQSSPEAYLDGWNSPVLLIHGDDDRNVPFSETVVLSEQLRDRGVYFEQLIFPDEVHGFLLHDNWLKCHEATFEFIDRHIGDR